MKASVCGVSEKWLNDWIVKCSSWCYSARIEAQAVVPCGCVLNTVYSVLFTKRNDPESPDTEFIAVEMLLSKTKQYSPSFKSH